MSDETLDCFELSLHIMNPWGVPLELTEAKYEGYARAQLHAFNLSWSASHITNALAVDFGPCKAVRAGEKISHAAISYRGKFIAVVKLQTTVTPPPGTNLRFEAFSLNITRIEDLNGHA